MSKLALRCLPPASTAGQSRVANPSTSSGTTTLRSWAGSRTDDTRRQARSLLVRQQRTTPQTLTGPSLSRSLSTYLLRSAQSKNADLLLLPYWRIVYIYDDPTDAGSKLTIVSSDVCANSPYPELSQQFLPFHQLQHPKRVVPCEAIAEPLPKVAQASSWTSSAFDAAKASFFAAKTWRVLPFAFGPPTDGLGGSSSKLRLLRRYAFPCYKYTAFFRDDNRWLLMTHYLDGVAECSTKERNSFTFVPVDLCDGTRLPGPVDLASGAMMPSSVPPEAFNFTKRDPLDWSSSNIQTFVVGFKTRRFPLQALLSIYKVIFELVQPRDAVRCEREIQLAEKKRLRDAQLAESKKLKDAQLAESKKLKDALLAETKKLEAARRKADNEERERMEKRRKQQELLRQREMAKEAAAYKLKYEQANREKARAARAARLERKRAVFEKVRAALLAKQRKPEPRLSRDSPPPQPRLSRDSPPPRPRLPPASDARPAVVALSFRLRDPDDLYALLDLSPLDFRTVPSNDVVRDARIDQLRVWHPDREGGDHERAQRINEAFERLATENLRTAYQARAM